MLSYNKTPSIHKFYFLSPEKQTQYYLHMQNQTKPLELKLFLFTNRIYCD